jgi:hypothetical protein
MYHGLGNHFRRTRWNSNVSWVMWNLIVSPFRVLVLVLVQDICIVCAKYHRLRYHFGRNQ